MDVKSAASSASESGNPFPLPAIRAGDIHGFEWLQRDIPEVTSPRHNRRRRNEPLGGGPDMVVGKRASLEARRGGCNDERAGGGKGVTGPFKL